MKRPAITIPILKGDGLVLWNGQRVINNMRSDPGDTHVNVTDEDDPYRFGIPTHRTGVVEVWRDGLRIWPPEVVQLEMFGDRP